MAVSRSFVVVVLLSLLSCVLRTAAVNQPYTHHAILTGEQAGTPSTALGAALVSFDGSTGNLDYTICNNVQDTTVAHIHGAGYPGVSAGVLVPIPGFASGGNATVRGTVNLNSTNADLLQSGQLYFNIHTGEFPNGEIRGQILKIGQQVTTLDANQEGGGVVSTALGYALTTFDSSSKQLSVVLNHNVSGATLAHIHGPAAPGVNAGVLITLAPNATVAQSNPITLTTILTDDQVTWLNQGLLYYNVHSGVYTGGEIRGQIEPIVNYAGELNGFNDNQTTDEWGVGFVALYGDALLAEVFHTVPDPIAAHIHTGAPFVSGGVTFPFSNPNSPIVQNFTATTDEVQNLVNGSDYFNVHTNAAQNGLIRGQIYPKVAVTGSQPSSSTSTSGATTLISSSIAIVLALLSLLL